MADNQTGIYILHGFKELGHEIVGIHDSFLENPETFLRMARELKPDLIFTAKVNSYNRIVKELSKVSLLTFWSYDVRNDISVWLQDTGPLYAAAHFFFTIGKSDVNKYARCGFTNCYWLPEGIDPSMHRKPDELTLLDKAKYMCDVAFAGSLGKAHDGAERLTLHNKLGLQTDFTYRAFSDVFNFEHNKLVNAATINIGNSGWPTVSQSMSARDYRIMGAGGFLLTNHVDGIEQSFKIGEICDIYESPDDCIDKIRYYLKNPTECKQMGLNAMEEMHRNHKFSDRLRLVIEVAEAYNK